MLGHHHFWPPGRHGQRQRCSNAATAAADGDVIAAVAKLPVTGFVPSSNTDTTRALPALWKELPKVKELSDKMVAETGSGWPPRAAT